MATNNASHRRTHNLLLISRLLSLQDRTSPFTLLLDSLEHSGKHLRAEHIRRASSSKIKIIFISLETKQPPVGIDATVLGHGKTLHRLQQEVVSLASPQRSLLIIDSLNMIVATFPAELASFLSSLIGPSTSLLATYHLDTLCAPSPSLSYLPHPLTLLKYLATTILSTHSLAQIFAKRQARDRSLEEPTFGLSQGVDGVVVGSGANDKRGTVIQMEYRRKSGRSVEEWFFLPSYDLSGVEKHRASGQIMLLEEHPLYATSEKNTPSGSIPDGNELGSTFNLGLTEKQKRDREGVVLPYFDAQKGDGSVGEGGRIIYDMGVEDDFDEEEDEI